MQKVSSHPERDEEVPITRSLPLAILLIGFSVTLSGCAGISYGTIGSEADDLKARGLRYYDSSPYLLVQTDNQGGLTCEFLYLPDQTKKRHAKPYTFLSSNTTTLEFQRAILTNSVSDTDSSVVPVAVVKALEQVASSAVKLATFDVAGGGKAERIAPRVYLFKIVKINGQWGLVGAEGDNIRY
jgi:hypothetical protein